MLKFCSVYEAYYPEILHHAIFINCNPAFKALFALMKNILPEKTVEKIKVFGTDNWETEVVKSVSPEQLRKFGFSDKF